MLGNQRFALTVFFLLAQAELLGHTRHEHAAAGTEADATGHEAPLSQLKVGHPPPPPGDLVSGPPSEPGDLAPVPPSDLPPEKERERARERQQQRQRSLPDDFPPAPPSDGLPPGPPDDDRPPSRTSRRSAQSRASRGREMDPRAGTLPTGRDPVEEIFHRFNRNGDDLLDMEEVRTLLEIAGFEVTDEYIHGLSSLFAKFDEDNSGGIELQEFRHMYDRLGLQPHTELLLGA